MVESDGMKIGVKYLMWEVCMDLDVVCSFCCVVEELGFGYLLLFDYVVKCLYDGCELKLIGFYIEKDSFDDLFVLFVFIVGIFVFEMVIGVLVLL